MIYRKTGQPIYSRCWGEFCYGIYKNNPILTGFLSVISKLPQVLGQEDELKSIEFMKTKFLFISVADELIVMIGINNEEISQKNENKAQFVLEVIKGYIESAAVNIPELDSYASNESVKLKHDLEYKLLPNIISFEFSKNELNHDEHCPLCIEKISKSTDGIKPDLKIWDILSKLMRKG